MVLEMMMVIVKVMVHSDNGRSRDCCICGKW